MIVYRLEDKKGYGPFNYGQDWPTSAKESLTAKHTQYLCTVPEARIGTKEHRDKYRFACRNITDLRKYWGCNLKDWENAGWIIAKYKVRKNYILIGSLNFELAFLIKKATRLDG